MREDKDHSYCADQDEDDYSISTDEDSAAQRRTSKRVAEGDDDADTMVDDKKESESKSRPAKRSIKAENSISKKIGQKWKQVTHKFCELPGLYSILLSVLFSWLQIHFKTFIGIKIA